MKNYFFLIWGTTVRNTSLYRQSRIFLTIFITKHQTERKIILEACEELPLGFDHYHLLICFIKSLFISKL